MLIDIKKVWAPLNDTLTANDVIVFDAEAHVSNPGGACCTHMSQKWGWNYPHLTKANKRHPNPKGDKNYLNCWSLLCLKYGLGEFSCSEILLLRCLWS